MKIGIISSYTNACPPLAYGGESYYWGIADTLGRIGHEVHLFAPAGSLVPSGGYLHYIMGTDKGVIDYGKEVWLEREHHSLLMAMDVIHDCSLDHIPAERLRHLYRKAEILNTINGRTYHMPRPPFNVVTGSKVWQEEARANGLETEMIYWGIDTSFYTPGEENIREDWYLWISRFHPDKGLDLALDLAEWLNIPLKVAGSMEFRDHEEHGKKYLERIQRLPSVEYIALPMDSTHHEKKRDLYRRAKAFIYPVQYFECFGMVVTEAMACGCPVITTRNGAMPEQIIDGETGVLCDTKNDFVAAIKSGESGELWDSMKSKCVERSRIFSWQAAAESYEELYRKVLQGYQWGKIS